MRQRRLTAYFSTPLSSPVYSEHQRIIARHQGYFWPKVVVRERPLSASSGHPEATASGHKRVSPGRQLSARSGGSRRQSWLELKKSSPNRTMQIPVFEIEI